MPGEAYAGFGASELLEKVPPGARADSVFQK